APTTLPQRPPGPTGTRATGSCHDLRPPCPALLARRPAPQVAPHPADQRKQAAERDQDAAVPDPGHERLPRQAQLPAPIIGLTAKHRVELAIPARHHRGGAGFLRRGPEAALLRANDADAAALVLRLESRFEPGPVRASDRRHAHHTDRPRAILDYVAHFGGHEPFLLERR